MILLAERTTLLELLTLYFWIMTGGESVESHKIYKLLVENKFFKALNDYLIWQYISIDHRDYSKLLITIPFDTREFLKSNNIETLDQLDDNIVLLFKLQVLV